MLLEMFITIMLHHSPSQQIEKVSERRYTLHLSLSIADRSSTDCIKSLHYPEIESRELTIDDAHPHTFDWFWSSSKVDFQDWLASPHGLYWIQGSPGSGKSTLLKYIARDPRLLAKLEEFSNDGLCAVAFYSFYVKSSDLAGSVQGMLQSLLWQLMKALPLAGESVIKQYKQIQISAHEVIWSSQQLLDALIALLQDLKGSAVCLLVDGLDEHHGSDEWIARYIDKLCSSVPFQVRFCVASRPYPDFAFEFSKAQTFTLQDHTVEDIAKYVQDRFKETRRFRDPSYDVLARAAIAKAKGSFLWTKLACDELQRNWRRFQSLAELELCLGALPSELNQLYHQIFKQLESSETRTLSRMLSILVESGNRLTIPEFCHIFDLSQQTSGNGSIDLLPARLETSLRNLHEERRFPSKCDCGILYFSHSPSCISGHLEATTHEYLLATTLVDVDTGSPNHANSEHLIRPESVRTRTSGVVPGDGLCFIGPGDTCRRVDCTTFNSPLQVNSVTACPHTAAYTCNSQYSSTKQWLDDTVERINLIGRGLIQATATSVSLAHETVTSFWKHEIVNITQKPDWFGKVLIVQACAFYLDLLAKFHFLPEEEIGYLERKRLHFHYPFLPYALENFQTYCSGAELASESSQADLLDQFEPQTWKYWQALEPFVFNKRRRLVHPQTHPMPLVEIAIQLQLQLTLKALISQLEDYRQHGSGSPSARLYHKSNTKDYALYLAAIVREPEIIRHLIKIGGEFSPNSVYATSALHAALSWRNWICLGDCLEACKNDESLQQQDTKTCFLDRTTEPRRWCRARNSRHYLDEEGAYSILEAATISDESTGLMIILPYARKIPAVTGNMDTALIAAVFHRRRSMVKEFLKAGVDPNVPSRRTCQGALGHTCCALSTAIGLKDVRLCKILLTNGADPLMAIEPLKTTSVLSCFNRTVLPHSLRTVEWPRTPFLIAIDEFAVCLRLEIFTIVCWCFQSGADLASYDGISQMMTIKKWTWLQKAYKRFYCPRKSPSESCRLHFVRLKRDDPFVGELIEDDRGFIDSPYGFTDDSSDDELVAGVDNDWNWEEWRSNCETLTRLWPGTMPWSNWSEWRMENGVADINANET